MVKRHEKCTDFFLTLWQKTDRGRSSYCSFVTNKIIVRFLTSSDPAHSCNSHDSYHFMKLIQIKSWFLCFCRVCKAIITLMRVHVLWLVLHILPCCLVLVIIQTVQPLNTLYVKSRYFLIAKESCEHQRGKPPGGSRGILPQKMLKFWCFEIPFLVLSEENMSKIFLKLIVICAVIFVCMALHTSTQ